MNGIIKLLLVALIITTAFSMLSCEKEEYQTELLSNNQWKNQYDTSYQNTIYVDVKFINNKLKLKVYQDSLIKYTLYKGQFELINENEIKIYNLVKYTILPPSHMVSETIDTKYVYYNVTTNELVFDINKITNDEYHGTQLKEINYVLEHN